MAKERVASHPGSGSSIRRVASGLLRWVGGPVATVLVASLVIYVGLSFAPGDPIAQVLGDRSTPEQRAALAASLGLDQPVLVRYGGWLVNAVQGDLGLSFAFRQPVIEIISPRLLTTLSLVAYAGAIIIIAGILLGSAGGVSRRLGPIVSMLIGLGIAVPGYVVALILVSLFAVGLGWFPTFGAGEGFSDRLWHLTLPAFALSIGWTAYIAQITSAAVREESQREHVMTAKARGLPPMLIFRRHIMRNAAIPVMTASGLAVAGLVAGAIVVESAFAIDGIGSLLVKSVAGKDYAVVVAIAVLIVSIFVLITTLIDLVQTLLDPQAQAVGKR
jgi:peptide/nickel transport system permease protein